MKNRFFSKINYAASNEDSAAELRALRLNHEDQVLCITGSGARALDLLTAAPARICCIDFNATQNHLLALKIAAYRQLDYPEFRQCMGLEPNVSKFAKWNHVFSTLPPATRSYWENRMASLKRGLLYCGTWEKILHAMSFASLFRRRRLNQLWHAPDLQTQRDIWDRHWAGWQTKSFLRLVWNRFLWTVIIREPGASLVSRQFDAAGYAYECLQRLAGKSLLRENPFANLIYLGRYSRDCILPFHLQERWFDAIREKTDRLDIVTGSLDEFLPTQPGRFSAYSLSDFSSYASLPMYEKIWKGVEVSAARNARFCERFFMVKREQEDIKISARSDASLERELFELDHTCFYTFRAGHVLNGDCSPSIKEA